MKLEVELPAGLIDDIKRVAQAVHPNDPNGVNRIVASSLVPVVHANGKLAFKQEDGKDYSISNIPGWVMTEFALAAKAEYPDDGELAWKTLLLNLMLSYIDADKASILVTDIPRDMMIALEDQLAVIGTNPEGLVSEIAIHAASGTLAPAVITLSDPDPARNAMILIRNVPMRSIDQLGKLSTEFNKQLPPERRHPEPVAQIQLLVEAIAMYADEGTDAKVDYKEWATDGNRSEAKRSGDATGDSRPDDSSTE